jgi:hypothetical protein
VKNEHTWRNRKRELEIKISCDVVTRHSELVGTLKSDLSCNISCSQVKLRSVTIRERFLSSTFLFSEDIQVSFDFLEGLLRTRLGKNLTSSDIFSGDTSEEETNIVTSLSVIELLSECFDTSDCDLGDFIGIADNIDIFTDLDLTGIDSACNDGTSSWNLISTFNWHHEGLFSDSFRERNLCIHDSEEFIHLISKQHNE